MAIEQIPVSMPLSALPRFRLKQKVLGVAFVFVSGMSLGASHDTKTIAYSIFFAALGAVLALYND